MVTEFPWEVLFHSLWLSDHGICKFLCEDYILIQSYAWTHIHTHVHTHTFRGTHSQSYPYSHIDTHTDSYYHTITLISHASKVILKIPQARLQQYVNCELPDVQAGFRKGRGTISFSRGSSRPGILPGSPALEVDALTSEPPGMNSCIHLYSHLSQVH